MNRRPMPITGDNYMTTRTIFRLAYFPSWNMRAWRLVNTVVLSLTFIAQLAYMAMAVDDCDQCTVAICETCQFNTDGLTSCHNCENCCLRQGRVYQWKRENKYDDIWTPELWGENREEQIGTSDVPVGGIVVSE